MVHDLIASREPADIRRVKETRWSTLKAHRQPVLHEWKDIGAHLLPLAARFELTDRDRGSRHKQSQIVDSSPMWSLRVSKAGIRAGTASPERKWFDYETMDPDLNHRAEVREWLDMAVDVIMRVCSRSNVYNVLDNMWGELLGFNTSCSVVANSARNVVHLYPVPIGEFCLAQDNEGHVNTMYREFEWTVGEVVDEFGLDVQSDWVKESYKNAHLERAVQILHAIEPRRVRNPQRLDNLNMRWESTYLEIGGRGNGAEGILRQGGFDDFPVLAPRWTVTGRNVYGHGPGMEVLPDIRQLQQEQMNKAKAIAYKADPPTQMPMSMKGLDRELFPGGVTFYDGQAPGSRAPIQSAIEVNFDIRELTDDIQWVLRRIDRAMFTDMFLMVADSTIGQENRTATEVAALHEEKLLQLGPTLQRLEGEGLRPLVDMLFKRVMRLGLLPPPPAELEDQELNVVFVGILAQAQRRLGMDAIDRWVSNTINLGQFKPEALDKINADELVDVSARRLGVEQRIVVPTAQAQRLREARNQALAAKEQLEAAEGVGRAAKDLSAVQGAGGGTGVPEILAQGTGL